MELPAWNIDSDRGRKPMARWLDWALNELESREIQKLQSPETSAAWLEEMEPPDALIARLAAGQATAVDQEKAAAMLRTLLKPPRHPAPRKPGRAPRHPLDRGTEQMFVFFALQDADRIKGLMRKHWGRVNNEWAVLWSCRRTLRHEELDRAEEEKSVGMLIEKVLAAQRRPRKGGYDAALSRPPSPAPKG